MTVPRPRPRRLALPLAQAHVLHELLRQRQQRDACVNGRVDRRPPDRSSSPGSDPHPVGAVLDLQLGAPALYRAPTGTARRAAWPASRLSGRSAPRRPVPRCVRGGLSARASATGRSAAPRLSPGPASPARFAAACMASRSRSSRPLRSAARCFRTRSAVSRPAATRCLEIVASMRDDSVADADDARLDGDRRWRVPRHQAGAMPLAHGQARPAAASGTLCRARPRSASSPLRLNVERRRTSWPAIGGSRTFEEQCRPALTATEPLLARSNCADPAVPSPAPRAAPERQQICIPASRCPALEAVFVLGHLHDPASSAALSTAPFDRRQRGQPDITLGDARRRHRPRP